MSKKKLDDLDKELDLFSGEKIVTGVTIANETRATIEEQLRQSRERIMRLKNLSNELRGMDKDYKPTNQPKPEFLIANEDGTTKTGNFQWENGNVGDKVIFKEKAYCGVDPGKSGAIAVMDINGQVVHRFIMPIIGDDIDIHELYNIFTGLKSEFNLTLLLEDVHSIFNSSAGSNFTFGFVCGAIEAIVISHSIKLIKCQPKTWQKEIWQNADKCYKPKKPEQKNPSIDTKATSLKAAKRMFPEFDFRKPNSPRSVNAHDGIVDSVLICEYARRKNL